MTFVGKESGVLGEQHKLKQRESMTHLVLSFYPCVFTVEILLPWLSFCQRELFFYGRFDWIDLSIVGELRAENLEVI